MLAFCHCNKMPQEQTTEDEKKVHFVYRVFSPLSLWFHCYRPVAKQIVTVGGRRAAGTTVVAGGKGRRGREGPCEELSSLPPVVYAYDLSI